MVTSDWDKAFENWKRKQEKAVVSDVKAVEKEIAKDLEIVVDEVKQVEKFVEKEKKLHPVAFNVIKWIVFMIPVVIIGYILFANFIASHEFNYVYDIGSEQDSMKSYLTPLNRISEADLNNSYRNLTSQLVYFDVPVARGADTIFVSAKIKSYYENASISLGAKNKEEWSYLSKVVYNPFLESLNLSKNITRINNEMPVLDNFNEIPSNSVVATDLDLSLKSKNNNFNITNFTFDGSLRAGHVFYLYLGDSLNLYVEKREINWYDGADDLEVTFLDINNTLIGSLILGDDGVDSNNRSKSKVINGSLVINNLSSGVYKLVFAETSDNIITKISLNTNKIVSNKLFFADSQNYLSSKDTSVSLYTKAEKDSTVSFQTYHDNYLQNISINGDNFEIKERAVWNSYNLSRNSYVIEIPRSNVIVRSNNYLSFSEENYFEPFEYSLVELPKKSSDLIGIDYIVTEYTPAVMQGDWFIVNSVFDVKDLYIKDGKLSLMFNIPHLSESNNDTNQNYVSIDWINTTVVKNGIF